MLQCPGGKPFLAIAGEINHAVHPQIGSTVTATVWILGDQLVATHPALELAEQQHGRDQLVVLMIESERRAGRLPYQRKKLVLLFSAMRHYAQELRSAGYRVDYRISPDTDTGVSEHLRVHQADQVYTMAASEYRGRRYQQRLSGKLGIPVTVVPNTQFLTGRFDPIPDPQPGRRYVQESFYRKMRQHFDLLVEPDGEPVGGRWNFDKENRKRLPADAEPRPPITFPPDPITRAVMDEVKRKYQGVGLVDGFNLAVTRQAARAAAQDFFDQRLADFGAYEDAMSSLHETIYHSRLSPYINIGLLDPLELAREAQERYLTGRAPLNSAEGFIRQVVGWREFIYWQYWRLMPGITESNQWNAERRLPGFFWTGETRMNCLRQVIQRALEHGYTHHIERLMVVSNFCLLAGIDPGAVNDWFLSAYIDAYEWVMVPNVYGMGLHADGGLIATKPYFSTANYINKMSDYCRDCALDRKSRTGEDACPFNTLYWNFILQHEGALRSNPRMNRSLLGLRHLDEQERSLVRERATGYLDTLS